MVNISNPPLSPPTTPGPENPGSVRVFLWGAVIGAASSLVAGALSLRDRWKKARDEGRVEERQKLESEISNQRRESDLRRREVDVRRWEIEEAQAEIQRLTWELRRLRESQSQQIAERDATISRLQAEIARLQEQKGAEGRGESE